MTTIVANGTVLTVMTGTDEVITSDSTVDTLGLLDGSGNVTGPFALVNLGTISADVGGAVLSINTGSLTNTGTMFANNGSLTIQSGVTVTNLAGGTLTGGVWEAAGKGVLTLLNGPITADNATIILDGPGSGMQSGAGTPQSIESTLLTVGASSALKLLDGRDFQTSTSLAVSGTVTLGGGGTLSAGGTGLVLNAGGRVIGDGTLDVNIPMVDGGTIEASGGTLAVPQSTLLTGAGQLRSDPGATLALLATSASNPYVQSIVNNGTIEATSDGVNGTLNISGSYSGTGGFLIQGGQFGAHTILELPVNLSAPVAFDTNAGELLLDFAPSFNGTISGFGNSDTLVLTDVGNVVSATRNGNILTLNGVGVTQKVTLDASSMDYSNANFHTSEDVSNTILTIKVTGAAPAACYAAGTRIKTETGEVAVERLAVGDLLHTHFAGTARVVWIGHRHVDCRRHPRPEKVWPVRVSAHAFGPRMPHRDLLLSPDHAVFVNDVLIPIRLLINGKTIAQQQVDTVTYYHVELGEHDVLLAEGMPAESYLENGDRAAFDNAGDLIALHPEFGARRWEALGCAPMVVTGAKFDAVLARCLARVPKPRAGRWVSRVA